MDYQNHRIPTSQRSSPTHQFKERRVHIPGRLDLEAHKPDFSRRPALQVLSEHHFNQRQDTSPGKETRIAHAPPHQWGHYWTHGTKTDYECRR